MTNQLASLAGRDYLYLDAFWRVNLGMYIINIDFQQKFYLILIKACKVRTRKWKMSEDKVPVDQFKLIFPEKFNSLLMQNI